MVVVIVIAVVSVTIATSIGRSNDRGARLEANRFMAVVNEVRDEAVISGDNFVLTVDEKAQSYRFQSARANATVDDTLLKTRKIPEDIKLEWEVLEVLEEDPEAEPKVFISSLGEITLFELRVGGDEHDYIVFVNDEGQLERRDRPSGFY